jgi:hypothetical protein
VEQCERRADDLVRRDEVDREDRGVDLTRVAHEELERSGAVDYSVDVERGIGEGGDADDFLDGVADQLPGSGRDVLGHCAVDDLLPEELLRDDLHQLHVDAVVEQVLHDEGLDGLGVGVDDCPDVLGGHVMFLRGFSLGLCRTANAAICTLFCCIR